MAILGMAASAQCTATGSAVDDAYGKRDWDEVVRLLRAQGLRTGQANFELGMALGHLGRFDEARVALLDGRRACPQQMRFDVELAGVVFQQKRYAEAAAWLRRGLRMNAHDAYALDFSGTVYYVMGNVPAALKFWNRVGKPYVEQLRFDQNLHVHRLIVDRAFAFAPAQLLKLSEYEATVERLNGQGIFQTYSIGLSAQTNGKFDADLHAIERNGFGNGWAPSLLAIFGGLPYETIYPSYYNIGGGAMNVDSLLRWDAQKRRAWIEVSAPLRKMPRRRWRIAADERGENWVVRKSFTGVAPALGSVHVSREVLRGTVEEFRTGRLTWSTGGEISHRAFTGITQGSALTSQMVSGGWQAKNLSAVDYRLLDFPERRFWITTGATSELARLWSRPAKLYEKLQGSERLRWFPQATGDVYEVEQRIRAGKTFGAAPFDELWMLGVERDNELWLRGLIGTRDRRKGSAPLGNSYFLANNDFYRQVYDNGLFSVKAGPLLDVGRMGSPTLGLATHDWMVAAGAQTKLTVLGTGIVLTYGRDLRAGTNAFYATVAKRF